MGVIFGRRRMDDIPGVAPYAPVSAIDGPVDPYAAPYSKPGGEVGTMVTPGSNPLAANKPSVGPQRRGVFGRLGAYFTPERLSLMAAALDEDGSAFGAEQERQRNARDSAAYQALRIRGQKYDIADAERSRQDADAQHAARERYRARLTPEERDAFALDPGGYIDSHRAADNWEIDDYGRPYAIRDGQVVYGQGRVGMRQSGGGSPPSGYRFAQNGNLEAIPGGPADTRATAEGQSRLAQMDSSERSLANAENAIADANRILNQPDGLGGLNVFNDATGLTGSAMRGVPGSRAFDLNQALEPVRAILSFETLAEMRRNSSTGGALGSIAVRELELLGNTVRSLDTGQSRQQLEANLRTVGAQLRRTRAAIAAARAEAGGQSQPPVRGAAPLTPAPVTTIDRLGRIVRVPTYNPATGRIE